MTQNGTVAGNGTQADALKIVIVGDGGCGKTSLLMVYAKGDFPEKYAPSVFDKYVTTVSYGGKDIQLNLYDTAGQEDYDRLRPLSYQEVNLVIICYDVTNPTSFDNVTIKWYPEVHHFCRDVPIILIGCKTDLRKDKEKTRKLKALDMAPITYLQVVIIFTYTYIHFKTFTFFCSPATVASGFPKLLATHFHWPQILNWIPWVKTAIEI
ncbi:rho-related GTP-binding protein RhoF isoform X2 [Siphateles boraxobius]|uniref:rho-related GTP-binding protein RhoF isoform X2 n=1 Tax=Siphateles boraxobius TaxID=180520 RepID=UPI004062B96B